MSASFDPYHTWLGIAPKHQPPNHYRLLGIELYEDNEDVIEHAADRQMAHVRSFQNGPQGPACQQLLNEISAARVCLLDPSHRAAYDQQLRATLAPAAPPEPPASPPPAAPAVEITIPAPVYDDALPKLAPLEAQGGADDKLKQISAERARRRQTQKAIRAAIGVAALAGLCVAALVVALMLSGPSDQQASVDEDVLEAPSNSSTDQPGPPAPTLPSPASTANSDATATSSTATSKPDNLSDSSNANSTSVDASSGAAASSASTPQSEPPSDSPSTAGMPWTYLGSGAFVETGIMDWKYERAPKELDAEFSGQRGRIWGTGKIDVMRVKRHTIAWLGRELRWQAAIPTTTDARIVFDSKHGRKASGGLQLQFFVEAADGKRSISFHLLNELHEEVALVAAPNGDVLFYDLSQTGPRARLRRPDFPLTIRLAGSVRNPGDKADTTFRIEALDAATRGQLLAGAAPPPPTPQWTFLGVGAHVRSFPELWPSASAPRELNGIFDGQTGRIWGAARFDVLPIQGKTVGWFGKELRWQVDSPDDVGARITFNSKHLPRPNRGPTLRFQVDTASGGRSLMFWLLSDSQEEINLAATEGGDLLVWRTSKPSSIERLTRPDYPLSIKLESSVRNPGEQMDSSFVMERVDSTQLLKSRVQRGG